MTDAMDRRIRSLFRAYVCGISEISPMQSAHAIAKRTRTPLDEVRRVIAAEIARDGGPFGTYRQRAGFTCLDTRQR